MQQPVYLKELSSAARHAKLNGMKREEFVCFATVAFNRADLRHQGIDGFTAFVYNNEAQEFCNKEERTDHDEIRRMECILNVNTSIGTQEPWVGNDNMKLTIPSPENSIYYMDSQGILD